MVHGRIDAKRANLQLKRPGQQWHLALIRILKTVRCESSLLIPSPLFSLPADTKCSQEEQSSHAAARRDTTEANCRFIQLSHGKELSNYHLRRCCHTTPLHQPFTYTHTSCYPSIQICRPLIFAGNNDSRRVGQMSKHEKTEERKEACQPVGEAVNAGYHRIEDQEEPK
ncbi:hypothetical protein BDV10DRAFT_6567 [Aspergillus recurvatus]